MRNLYCDKCKTIAENVNNLPPSAMEISQKLLAILTEREAGNYKPVPLPDSWTYLADNLDGGLWPGTNIIAAPSAVGKTQFVCEIVRSSALNGIPTLFIALEMPSWQIMARLSGIDSDTYHSNIMRVIGKNDEYRKNKREIFIKSVKKMSELPIFIQTPKANNWDYNRIKNQLEKIRSVYHSGPILLVVDFMQLLSSDRPEDIRLMMKNAAYCISDAANEYNTSALIVSQTSRENHKLLAYNKDAKGISKVPPWEQPAEAFMTVSKEAGEIEQSAVAVLVMAKDLASDSVYIGVSKQRDGTSGNWFEFSFDGKQFKQRSPWQNYEIQNTR